MTKTLTIFLIALVNRTISRKSRDLLEQQLDRQWCFGMNLHHSQRTFHWLPGIFRWYIWHFQLFQIWRIRPAICQIQAKVAMTENLVQHLKIGKKLCFILRRKDHSLGFYIRQITLSWTENERHNTGFFLLHSSLN